MTLKLKLIWRLSSKHGRIDLFHKTQLSSVFQTCVTWPFIRPFLYITNERYQTEEWSHILVNLGQRFFSYCFVSETILTQVCICTRLIVMKSFLQEKSSPSASHLKKYGQKHTGRNIFWRFIKCTGVLLGQMNEERNYNVLKKCTTWKQDKITKYKLLIIVAIQNNIVWNRWVPRKKHHGRWNTRYVWKKKSFFQQW